MSEKLHQSAGRSCQEQRNKSPSRKGDTFLGLMGAHMALSSANISRDAKNRRQKAAATVRYGALNLRYRKTHAYNI